MKISYRLENAGKFVVFKVLKMDNRFRRNEPQMVNKYVASNGIVIISAINPALTRGSVYLRGSNNLLDNTIAVVEMPTSRAAIKYIKDVKEAISEWAEKWEGFREGNEKDDTIVEIV